MEDVTRARLPRVLLSVAGALLLVLWLASMALDDDRLCSSVPLSFGYAAVLALGVVGVLAGVRPAKPSACSLFGLAAGLYFLIRCLAGDMLPEIWRELPLILASLVLYGAGYLLAQWRRGGTAFMTALAVGVVLNVFYLFLLRQPGALPEWSGRPSMTMAGTNYVGCTLFTYENFSAMFLAAAGGVLACRPLWVGWRGWSSLLSLLLGAVGIGCSFLCDSRAIWGIIPLVVLVAWVLWVIIRLYGSQKIGWGLVLSGLLFFVGIAVLLGELFMGNELMQHISSVDTHGRTLIWRFIYPMLPEVPWYGYGAGASTWQLVPVITHYALPNYAHNEYLQAWVDYGFAGVCLVMGVLFWHLASGFWSMASEDVGRERRALVSACMMLLLVFAGCAVFDFIWHNVALAGLSAFACGVLASPVPSRREPFFRRRKWAPGSGPSLRPVLPVGKPGAALICVGALSLAALCAGFGWRLLPAWKAQWEYNALWHQRAPELERMKLLERMMPQYPDPELVDHYVTLRAGKKRPGSSARKEKMMRLALEANPHQMFTVVMLADLLGRRGRYEEAEALLRDNYLRDGQPATSFANWPGYYGVNLLMWGHQHLRQGNHATALSMMEHAFAIWGHANGFRYQSACARRIERNRNKIATAYIAARRVDVDMLRAIGVKRDDSWKKPMRPGGAPALYERWQNKPHERKMANPYAKRSPLKL